VDRREVADGLRRRPLRGDRPGDGAHDRLGGVTFVSQMTVTLSCDHRVLDGRLAAKLPAEFNNCVENPVTFLV
jgi:pyruvate/2-oxoglutarate dehydrogenase complex dihydrolipoamide acyltransferase (E2) component